jgi:DNA-binding MarR family transcriptional regulator
MTPPRATPAPDDASRGAGKEGRALGAMLREAWIGYRRRLESELAEAGFSDRGFPDGRVLRLCAGAQDVTASEVGRRLGITRQGASKVVASLRRRGYVTLEPSQRSGREKLVRLTPRALHYLEAHRAAARKVERQLRDELGSEVYDAAMSVLGALRDPGHESLRDFLGVARSPAYRGDLEA